LLIFFTFLTVSCNNKKNTHSFSFPLNVIPVEKTVGNYNILNLSEYVTDIKYIPLETNDASLISRIHQIIYENEKILILDFTEGPKKCYLFDNNGKFCQKIGQRGQGPDDYLYINNVSMYDNFIYLMDVRKIFIYDTNGSLIEKNNLRTNEIPEEYFLGNLFSIMPLKKDTFIMDVVSTGSYPIAILFEIYQSNAKAINEYPGYVKLNKVSQRASTDELGKMYRFKDEVRTYKIINDTIFTIGQSLEMKEAFIFELGKYRPTLSFIEGKEGNRGFDLINARNKYIIPQTIYESVNHLFIGLHFGNHAPEPIELTNSQGGQYFNGDVYGIFDKRTGELTLMSQPIKGKLGFKNDIDNGPVIWPRYISSNNELVTYISVEDFLDYYEKIENPTPQMTEIAKNIKMDDNPIVIIAKLKE